MRFPLASALLFAVLTSTSGALAHDAGHVLDELLGSEEQYFQPINEPARPFELVDTDGNPVQLSDFGDRVVVLDFVFASCTDLCPLQSEVLADVQDRVNASLMKDMVQFITVTTDPAADTSEVMRNYGEAHGLDPVNWAFLTVPPGAQGDMTRQLSTAYKNTFTPMEDGQQMHGAVFHVIDQGGRLAAKFHGLQFEPVNMVLYINDLSDNAAHAEEHTEDWGWEGLASWF